MYTELRQVAAARAAKADQAINDFNMLTPTMLTVDDLGTLRKWDRPGISFYDIHIRVPAALQDTVQCLMPRLLHARHAQGPAPYNLEGDPESLVKQQEALGFLIEHGIV